MNEAMSKEISDKVGIIVESFSKKSGITDPAVIQARTKRMIDVVQKGIDRIIAEEQPSPLSKPTP